MIEKEELKKISEAIKEKWEKIKTDIPSDKKASHWKIKQQEWGLDFLQDTYSYPVSEIKKILIEERREETLRYLNLIRLKSLRAGYYAGDFDKSAVQKEAIQQELGITDKLTGTIGNLIYVDFTKEEKKEIFDTFKYQFKGLENEE